MRTISEESDYYLLLIRLINAINWEVPLRDEDKVLMMFHLNTEDKIVEFNQWLRSKMEGEHLKATPKEIMHQTAVISRMDI